MTNYRSLNHSKLIYVGPQEAISAAECGADEVGGHMAERHGTPNVIPPRYNSTNHFCNT